MSKKGTSTAEGPAERSLLGLLDRGLIKRAVVYLASGSASALISFLLLPVLTKYLSPYDYGLVETFTTVATCLTGIFLVGGNTLLAKEYFDQESRQVSELLGNVMSLVIVLAVVSVIAIRLSVLMGVGLPGALRAPEPVLQAAVLASAANAIVALYTTQLQAQKRATKYAIFVNSKSLIDIAGSLLLILVFALTWEGRLGGMLFASALYAVLAFTLFSQEGVRLKWNRTELSRIARLGFPMVAAHVSVWVYGMLDRAFINHLFDVEATGLYAVGYRFATVINMVETAFSIAWMPYFFETVKMRTVEADQRLVRATWIYIVGLLLSAVAFGCASSWLLPRMVDSRFYDAARYVMPLCLAFWLSGAWKMFNGYLIAEAQTKLYGLITVTAGAIHIVLTWAMLKTLGPIGAAWATLFTFGLAAGATAVAAHRLRPMPWFFRHRG